MRACLTYLAICLAWLDLAAQDQYGYAASRIAYGNVIVHSQDLRPMGKSFPVGFEIDYGKHKSSQKVWDACNCYPRSGLTLSFWDFDNQAVLGYGGSAMYYIQPVFGTKRKVSFSLRAAAGLSYQTNPFDEESNPDNLSYSTYWGIPLQLGIAAHLRIKEQWTLDLHGVLNHISNAGLEEPNKGINWPTVSIGLSRYFNAPEFTDRTKTDWRKADTDLERFDISTFTTYHSPNSGTYVFSWGVEGKYLRRFSSINNFSVGTEYLFNNQKVFTDAEGVQHHGHNLGIALGNEFILGKILFAQQFAAYLIRPENEKNDVYQRYTLIYRINDRIHAGVGLKAHGHVADFGDFRVGISF